MRTLAALGLFLVVCVLWSAPPSDARTLGQRTLHKGSRGSDVVTLQRILVLKGYSVGPADGVFGRRTKVAVKRFQRRRALARDGRVGPATTRALARTWRGGAPTPFGPGPFGQPPAGGLLPPPPPPAPPPQPRP